MRRLLPCRQASLASALRGACGGNARNWKDFCGLTPLPQLFSALSACRQKDVALFFEAAGRALSVPPGCTVPVSFKRGFQASSNFAPGQEAAQALYGLSLGLGRFDLESQLAAIERAKGSITSVLLQLQAQKRARCRSYETIGICAGLALAVILL